MHKNSGKCGVCHKLIADCDKYCPGRCLREDFKKERKQKEKKEEKGVQEI